VPAQGRPALLAWLWLKRGSIWLDYRSMPQLEFKEKLLAGSNDRKLQESERVICRET